jgi:hypothetical protein
LLDQLANKGHLLTLTISTQVFILQKSCQQWMPAL